MKLMTLEFPLDKDVLTAVRLVTGGICAQIGFDLDEAEDCKVCVTESLLLLSRRGGREVRVSFEKEDRLNIFFEAKREAPIKRSNEEEISVALLSALVEGLQISTDEDRMRISFGIGTL